jgi:hypothetical protein
MWGVNVTSSLTTAEEERFLESSSSTVLWSEFLSYKQDRLEEEDGLDVDMEIVGDDGLSMSSKESRDASCLCCV